MPNFTPKTQMRGAICGSIYVFKDLKVQFHSMSDVITGESQFHTSITLP